MFSNLLLLLTAALWGFAFVAQRLGSESLDAFSFNALRFALGAIFVRFALYKSFRKRSALIILPGTVLFVAASLQQIGIIFTSAGSAGFITGLYVVFVPLIGLLRGQRVTRKVITSILLAVIGLYLINSFKSLDVSLGNFLVLISAVFFAWHVQIVDKLSKIHPTGLLAFDQFAVCALLSTVSALIWRGFIHPGGIISKAYLMGIRAAFWPILYGGLISVGIAYTLQIKAQQKADPAPAAVIMCLEGVFALLGGWLLLSEELSARMLFGAGFLLGAMLLLSVPAKNSLTEKGHSISVHKRSI
jgi:drug/metabolite transporter (DMT)-like permease